MATSNDPPPIIEPISWRDAFTQADVVVGVAVSWVTRRRWMHRRVDTFDFRDDLLVRCRSSIDITVPESAPIVPAPHNGAFPLGGLDAQPLRVIPLFVAAKNQPTISFDLRDESDRPISRLRAEQSGLLGGVVLITLAEKILELREPLPAEDNLRSTLKNIAQADNFEVGTEAWRRLVRSCLGEESGRSPLAHDASFQHLVKLLAENHLMCALASAAPGQQRVFKVTVDHRFTMERRLKEMAGWVDFLAKVRVPYAADPASYHCHINVPEGVEITGYQLKPDPPVEGIAHPYDISSEAREPKYLHFIATDCAREYDYASWVTLQARRSGWLKAALVSGFGVTLLFFLCWHLADRFVVPLHHEVTVAHTDVVLLFAALFLAAVATIVALLARSGEHLLTSTMLRFLRVVMYGLTLLPFAATLLLGFAESKEMLSTAFASLFWLAVTLVLPLTVAFLRPWRGRPRGMNT